MSAVGAGRTRRRRLAEAFERLSGGPPDAFVRAPGRVNLIGEHIDYNGFAVLPMTLDRDTLGAFRRRPDRRIRVASLEQDGVREIVLEPAIPPFAAGDWGNYVKAAAQGLADRLGVETLRGLDLCVTGTIPPSAGLSSSSALVVLSALAILNAADRRIPALELAGLLADAERYVGTQGGGMDQAVILLGREGAAIRVSFDPLAAEAVPLPADFRIVVANSMVRASKSESQAYNTRAAECRLAAAALSGGTARRLGDLPAPVDPDALPAGGCGVGELSALLGLSPDELRERHLRQRDGSFLAEPEGGFRLRDRAAHVFAEAARVGEAAVALGRGDAAALGALMDASHASCRDLYRISCPELDRLTALARECGALGSRLTGAGFGGCTVSLVPADRLERFVAEVGRRYHRESLGYDGELGADLFAARPSAAAEVLGVG